MRFALCLLFFLVIAIAARKHKHGKARNIGCFDPSADIGKSGSYYGLEWAPRRPPESRCSFLRNSTMILGLCQIRDANLWTSLGCTEMHYYSGIRECWLWSSLGPECNDFAFNMSYKLQCIPSGPWEGSCQFESLENNTLCANCETKRTCRSELAQKCDGKLLSYIFGTLQCVPDISYTGEVSNCVLTSLSEQGYMCATCRVRNEQRTICTNVSSRHCNVVVPEISGLFCIPGGSWRSSCVAPRYSSSGMFGASCLNTANTFYTSYFTSFVNLTQCDPLSVYSLSGALQCKPFPPGRWRQSCVPLSFDQSELCVSQCYSYNGLARENQCLGDCNSSVIENFNGTLVCAPGGPWTTSERISSLNETTLCVNSTQSCIGFQLCQKNTIQYLPLEQALVCAVEESLPKGPWSLFCAPISYSSNGTLCARCFVPGRQGSSTLSCIESQGCSLVYNVNGTLSCAELPVGVWNVSCIATNFSDNLLCGICPNRAKQYVSSCFNVSWCQKGQTVNRDGHLHCFDYPDGVWQEEDSECRSITLVGSEFCGQCHYRLFNAPQFHFLGQYSCLDISRCKKICQMDHDEQKLVCCQVGGPLIGFSYPNGDWKKRCDPVSFLDGKFCAACGAARKLTCITEDECTVAPFEFADDLQCRPLPTGPWRDGCKNVSWPSDNSFCATCTSSRLSKWSCVNCLQNLHMTDSILHCGTLPGGIWRSTCSLDSFDGKTLCASCEHNSTRKYSCIDASSCSRGVFNMLGELWCEAPWIDVCRPLNYTNQILCASCNSSESCLDLSSAKCTQPLYNFYGTLQCVPLPRGSYEDTCKSFSFTGGKLCAQCHGSTYVSCLDSPESCLRGVESIGGKLSCIPPLGPYRTSCFYFLWEGGKTFCAKCHDENGSLVDNCVVDNGCMLLNDNGALRCLTNEELFKFSQK